MASPSQGSQQLARQKQQEVDERRRQSLLSVACALRDPSLSDEVVKDAMRQVDLWRSKKICSRDYVEAWEALLKHPEQAAKLLEEKSPYATQLRQNSPFVSTVRKYKADNAA